MHENILLTNGYFCKYMPSVKISTSTMLHIHTDIIH